MSLRDCNECEWVFSGLYRPEEYPLCTGTLWVSWFTIGATTSSDWWHYWFTLGTRHGTLVHCWYGFILGTHTVPVVQGGYPHSALVQDGY